MGTHSGEVTLTFLMESTPKRKNLLSWKQILPYERCHFERVLLSGNPTGNQKKSSPFEKIAEKYGSVPVDLKLYFLLQRILF